MLCGARWCFTAPGAGRAVEMMMMTMMMTVMMTLVLVMQALWGESLYGRWEKLKDGATFKPLVLDEAA